MNGSTDPGGPGDPLVPIAIISRTLLREVLDARALDKTIDNRFGLPAFHWTSDSGVQQCVRQDRDS